MIKDGILSQYYAVICGNLITLSYGVGVGWPSANLPLLKSVDTPLPSGPLTLLEASWISSIICIGGAVGTVFFGWLADKFGRKPAMIFSFIPTAGSWLLIEFGKEFYSLFIARFLIGFSGGGAFQVIPLIVSEIANANIRGRLGACIMLMQNAGCVLGYIMCSYLNYHLVPWIGIVLAILFLIGYIFVPETPKYLLMTDRKEEAIKALGHFRGSLFATEDNLKLYAMEVGGDTVDSKTMKFQDLCDPATKKAIIIGTILMNTVVFSGAFTLANYYETIFREAGSTLSPAASSIIVAFIQFTGTYSATLTIERAGRKILVLASAYLSALCLAIMGIYSLLKDFDVDVSSFTWLPLVCLSLLAFIAANGATCVPFVVMGEIYAQRVRGPLVAYCMFVNWIDTFLFVLVFPYLMEYLKMYGALWILSIGGVVLTTILAVIMPETKGLSIERIVDILGK